MKSVVKLLTIFVMGILFSQAVFAWGALAIDENQGDQYGWAVDYETREEAINKALEECGDGGRIVLTFSGGAAAYAADQSKGSTIYGWGRAETAAEAKEIALKEAQKRGAKNPIVRVWGQETSVAKDFQSDKIKVFVKLSLGLNEKYPGKINGYDADYNATFVGWTYISKQELMQYGQLYSYLLYSDDVLGSRRNATHLITTGNNNEYRQTDHGDITYSPVMTRFVKNVVEKHPLYLKRKQDPKYYNGVQAKFSDKEWLYKGYIVIIDQDWTYETIKKSLLHYELTDEYSVLYKIVDANEF